VLSRGGGETLAQVKAEVEARDARDADRSLAPLKPADDAHLLDTSDLAIDGAFAAALAIIEANIRR
jgi:cytidylate kinase